MKMRSISLFFISFVYILLIFNVVVAIDEESTATTAAITAAAVADTDVTIESAEKDIADNIPSSLTEGAKEEEAVAVAAESKDAGQPSVVVKRDPSDLSGFASKVVENVEKGIEKIEEGAWTNKRTNKTIKLSNKQTIAIKNRNDGGFFLTKHITTFTICTP